MIWILRVKMKTKDHEKTSIIHGAGAGAGATNGWQFSIQKCE